MKKILSLRALLQRSGLIVLAGAVCAVMGCTSAPDVEGQSSCAAVACTLTDDRAGYAYGAPYCDTGASSCYCGATCGTNDDCDTGCCGVISDGYGTVVGHACSPACVCGL